MTPPLLLLDGFCGAGGAAKGYRNVGFEPVGIDIKDQPNYPYDFIAGDAIELLGDLIVRGWAIGPSRRGRYYALGDFAGIHTSPPCHARSTLRYRTGKEYVDLVPDARELLKQSPLPYVIENVPGGSPMENPVQLCGSSFGLGAGGRQLRRHRLFECSFAVMALPCQHRGQPVGVYGTGGGGQMTRGYKGTPEEYEEAMGIDWATRAEIAQAIPPAYTEHIGLFLMAEVLDRQDRAAA